MSKKDEMVTAYIDGLQNYKGNEEMRFNKLVQRRIGFSNGYDAHASLVKIDEWENEWEGLVNLPEYNSVTVFEFLRNKLSELSK